MASSDKKAIDFLAIVEANKGILYKIANAYREGEDDRKDLIQEIIIQLWQSFDKYDPKFKLSTWMYRIALNVSISLNRKAKSREKISQPISDTVIYLLESEETVLPDPNLAMLHQFIAELKELDRALILLYLEEKSQREMAEILGISSTNVSTKVTRVKEKLRKKFESIKE